MQRSNLIFVFFLCVVFSNLKSKLNTDKCTKGKQIQAADCNATWTGFRKPSESGHRVDYCPSCLKDITQSNETVRSRFVHLQCVITRAIIVLPKIEKYLPETPKNQNFYVKWTFSDK